VRIVVDTSDLADASPQARQLYEYWRARRGGAAWPRRADIDPLEFGFALGRVSLIERIDGRFRYRIVSTGLTAHLGYEMTGKFADEIPAPEARRFVHEQYSAAMAGGVPLYAAGGLRLDGQDWHHETLILPLSSDGTAADMLMIYRATEKPRKART